MTFVEFIQASLLGIIQGITEWLPISSTGHLILADEFIKLPVSKEFKDMFMVVIQLGSILAVLLLYFKKLNPFYTDNKKIKLDKSTMSLWYKVIIGIIPAGIAGILFDDKIDTYLYNSYVVALALIIYGIFFIIIEKKDKVPKICSIDNLSYKTALLIGVFQILALVPGTSRSGSTILGAVLLGTSRTVAAEFSFFLAIPIMFGASGLKLFKFFLGGNTFSQSELGILITGFAVSFIVSVFAIKFLVGYIKKHDFKAFGYYRIILGIIVFFTKK